MMKVWAKRHRDLSRHRTRLASRLHAVLCELTPGGFTGEISAAQATRLLDELEPAGAVAAARHAVAAELITDLSRLDEQLRDTKQRSTTAVKASKTTLTELFGVGPIIAAIIIGDVADVSRFASRDHFAAYNGTAPIEVSSGARRKVFRLSRRGNRRLNHAIHMAAVTQIRHHHSPGRADYDRKIAEGHTGKAAIRALKRRISDAIYTRLRHDAARTAARTPAGPGGQPGNDAETCAAGSHPEHQLFGQATPEPDTTLRPAATKSRSPRPAPLTPPSQEPLDKQRGLDRSWRRNTPLTAALWTTALVGIALTTVLAVGSPSTVPACSPSRRPLHPTRPDDHGGECAAAARVTSQLRQAQLRAAADFACGGWCSTVACYHGGMAKNLTVRLDDDLAADTEALARAEGQSLNETVKTALREAVERRRRDPKFKARVKQIMNEDRELLERLAK